jgi:mannose-6-phosphate isomerase-like protein (cupin superfamily)
VGHGYTLRCPVAASHRSRHYSCVTSFELEHMVAALRRDGSSEVVQAPPGKPLRIDGFTVGAPLLTSNPPHRGELHPDGDELLYLVSGHVDVILDDGDQDHVGTERVVSVRAGEAFLVPRGVWHRVELREPSRLVHITPGPGDGHRPL